MCETLGFLLIRRAVSQSSFDIIVIGGGHAGTEAAHAAARMGCSTLLLTLNPARIGWMSCNPAMGGLAKGQLIKEIDALGGIMGQITDKTAIQYRRLNSSKGPAVRSSRAQCDKELYAKKMQEFLARVPGLTIASGEVTELLWDEATRSQITGIRLASGERVSARAVIITSGTFLRALMYTGLQSTEGGRVGDASARGLSGALEALGFRLRRLKTGTPPRLHRASIRYELLERQPGDDVPKPFSFYYRGERFPELPQVDCWITYTNPQAHEIIDKNSHQSPMFSGLITGVGPRYCPSIEDKVKRFKERERHQIFLEPEGLTTDEVYVNGISTSLPAAVQEEFLRKIVGLEQAQFIRHGYAVEYDAVDARQLQLTLESKDVQGLYFAGQVNGTSGYEEAGAQGLMAGMNAALKIQAKEPLIIQRSEGYIGVLIDDLVLKGSDEPYRMFTSRAEYRLLLREDNADLRLAPLGYRAGLLSGENFRLVEAKRDAIARSREELKAQAVFPVLEVQEWLKNHGMPEIKDRVVAETFLRRPETCWNDLISLGVPLSARTAEVAEQIEIQVKYEGYIQRDLDLLEGIRKNELLRVPSDLNYEQVPGLSNEIRGRLRETRPETMGQVGRIQGVTPAAVANLLIYLKMKISSAEARP